jgi:hypothetical protein
MTNIDARLRLEDNKGVDRWNDEGGASRRPKRSAGKLHPPNAPAPPRPDPANPLLNPATSLRHPAEDAAPDQPNELPNPEHMVTRSDADSDHPLGTHERQGTW